MILFECPGMIGPLDTATLARRRIIPFWGRERYDSRISEQKILPVDRALLLLSSPQHCLKHGDEASLQDCGIDFIWLLLFLLLPPSQKIARRE